MTLLETGTTKNDIVNNKSNSLFARVEVDVLQGLVVGHRRRRHVIFRMLRQLIDQVNYFRQSQQIHYNKSQHKTDKHTILHNI